MPDIDWMHAYQTSRSRIVEIIDTIDKSAAATRVPACPAWTVHDVVAHVTGLAVDLGAGRLPSGPAQPWIDGHVASRRGHPLGLLVDEWLASDVEGFLQKTGSGQLVYDLCAHEHDICHALRRAGDRDSFTVHAAVRAMTDLLNKDLAAEGAPGAIELSTEGRSWIVGEGPMLLRLDASPFELIRIFGSRRSVAQLRALPWHAADGAPADIDPWLDAIAHFDFPVTDLVE